MTVEYEGVALEVTTTETKVPDGDGGTISVVKDVSINIKTPQPGYHLGTHNTVYKDGEPLHTLQPAGGPPVVEDERVNGGLPVSFFDLLWTQQGNEKPKATHRAVPIDRNYGDTDPNCKLELVTRDALHKEASASGKGKGRPPKFDRATMTAAKANYWSGKATIKALAGNLKTTEPTVSRIVHGLVGWYA
jgi:hypothetical protein